MTLTATTVVSGEAPSSRSLIFDLFGDYLRYRGGQVRLQTLIALMGAMNVPEATVRVAAARLRKDGWLSTRKDGRETIYALTDQAWALLDEGRTRIFSRVQGPWDGQWHMIIYTVPEVERAAREQLRKRLAWMGFGPLSASVWLSPHDRPEVMRADLLGPSVRIDAFCARSHGLDADREIAARCWDLNQLDRGYAAFIAAYASRLAGYRAGTVRGSAALIERMRLIHDYRRFPFRDPDLPPELLPQPWSGRRAHEVFLEAHGLLRRQAEDFVDSLSTALIADGR